MKDWKILISSADVAPSTAPILLQGDIIDCLKKASELGYNGIERHLRETEELDYIAIRETCAQYNVQIGQIITGRLKTEGMADLIDDRTYITDAAIAGMKKYIDMCEKLGTNLVIGWVRGAVPDLSKKKFYMDRLAKNIKMLCIIAAEKNVKVSIEVLNRYEINTFNYAHQLVDFINEYDIPNCYVHLDTFHMSMEENDPIAAIKLAKDNLGYFHLADNTRWYPGTAQIDFKSQLKALEEIGYNGWLSVECFPRPDWETAATNALAYIRKISQEI